MSHNIPQFEMQEMPHELDQNIQASFERKSFRDQLRDALGLRSTLWPVTVFATCAAFYVITGHGDIYQEAEVWASVVDRETHKQIASRGGITYEKSIVKEGKDKSLVVAIENDLSQEVTAAVAKRFDTVEVWSHNITTLVKSEKNIDLLPAHVTLNLESDDHLHLFESVSTTCETSNISDTCAKEKLTKEGVAHRTLFDGVHDIQSNYDRQTNPQIVKKHEAFPQMKLVSSDGASFVFRHLPEDGVRVDYYFDTQTFDRQREITSIALDDQWYEMAVKNYVDYKIVPATEFATIFDTKAYTLEQKLVIPLPMSTSI